MIREIKMVFFFLLNSLFKKNEKQILNGDWLIIFGYRKEGRISMIRGKWHSYIVLVRLKNDEC